MWGNYPQHELGKVEQLPQIDWLLEPKERRPELAERSKKKDLFKQKIDVEKGDHDGQRMMS